MFDGLLNHSLDAIRFTIYADKDNSSNVLELYTFCFQYSNTADLQDRRLAGIAITGRGGENTIMANARTGIINIMTHIREYNQILPDLPRE